LRDSFIVQQERAIETIQTVLPEIDRSIQAGALESAEGQLVRLDTAFSELVDNRSVVRALDLLGGRYRPAESGVSLGRAGAGVSDSSGDDDGDRGGENRLSLQEEIERRRVALDQFAPADVGQAAQYMARLLAGQFGRVERVTPLLYEDADFSSAFGSRMSAEITSAISRRTLEGTGSVVVRGSYWPEDERVAIHVVARDIESGRTVAAAQTSIPRSAVESASLRPANMDQAIAAGRALLNDQIVDGGLDLEVWTDKGRDERALVFEEEEYVQFYFRVNQPAFLRLSYVLASGETVLLEDRFYIGIDRVNRVVALPYRFEVVPPFGVERLIVTGHTMEPPPADAYPQVIDGQRYEVFGSPGAAVARTRGLVRERPPEDQSAAGVAEASLSLTTIARSPGR
jgi:hypothetical protein